MECIPLRLVSLLNDLNKDLENSSFLETAKTCPKWLAVSLFFLYLYQTSQTSLLICPTVSLAT